MNRIYIALAILASLLAGSPALAQQWIGAQGTQSNAWALGVNNGGANAVNVNDNGGVVEFKNSGNNALVVARGAAPVGNSDLTNKAYVDTHIFGAGAPSLINGECLGVSGGVVVMVACGGGGSTPTGTGFRYVVSGTENAASVTFSGDVSQSAISGTSIPLTVLSLQGHAVSASAPSSANLLVYNSSTWTPTAVTGDASISSSGVVTVGQLQGSALPSTPGSTECLARSSGGVWSYAACSGAGTSVTGTGLWYSASGSLNSAAVGWSGDASFGALSGGNIPVTITRVNGTTVPAGGSLTTGNVLQVSGASAATWGAVNLAGGSGSVVNVLPSANQAAQTMAGDVTGTTAASTVASLQGNSLPLTPGSTECLARSSVGVWSYQSCSGGGGYTSTTGDVISSGSGAVATTVESISGSSAGAQIPVAQGSLYVGGLVGTPSFGAVYWGGLTPSAGNSALITYANNTLLNVGTNGTLSLGINNTAALGISNPAGVYSASWIQYANQLMGTSPAPGAMIGGIALGAAYAAPTAVGTNTADLYGVTGAYLGVAANGITMPAGVTGFTLDAPSATALNLGIGNTNMTGTLTLGNSGVTQTIVNGAGTSQLILSGAAELISHGTSYVYGGSGGVTIDEYTSGGSGPIGIGATNTHGAIQVGNTAAGGLTLDSGSNIVFGASGAASSATLSSSAWTWGSSVSGGTFTQAATSSGPGATMGIVAQTTTAAAQNGGELNLTGGGPGFGGIEGPVEVSSGTGSARVLVGANASGFQTGTIALLGSGTLIGSGVGTEVAAFIPGTGDEFYAPTFVSPNGISTGYVVTVAGAYQGTPSSQAGQIDMGEVGFLSGSGTILSYTIPPGDAISATVDVTCRATAAPAGCTIGDSWAYLGYKFLAISGSVISGPTVLPIYTCTGMNTGASVTVSATGSALTVADATSSAGGTVVCTARMHDLVVN